MSRVLCTLLAVAVCQFPDLATLRRSVADEAAVEPAKKASKSSLVSLEDIERALELPCPEIPIDGSVPLPDLLKIISQHLAATAGHPVPFLADHVELKREGLTTIDEYELRIAKIHAGTHTCFDLLQLLLKQAVDPTELAIVPRRGQILVTTLAKAYSDEMLETRLYDVSDLLPNVSMAVIQESSSQPQARKQKTLKPFDENLAPTDSTPSSDSDEGSTETKDGKTGNTSTKVFKQFGGAGGGGFQQQSVAAPITPIQSLVILVQEQTSPPARWTRLDGEGGSLNVYGHHFVIYQTYHVHRQITQLLSQLRDAIRKGELPRLEVSPATNRGRGTGFFSVSAEDSLQSNSDQKATLRTAIVDPSNRLPPLTRNDIEKALQLPCPEVAIKRGSPLADAIDMISKHLAITSGRPVAFVQDYAELELEGITSIHDVEARSVNIAAGTHMCRDVLELLFEQTAEPELTFIPRNGHVLITTLAKAESSDFFESRVYNLSELLKPRAGENGSTMSGTKNVGDADNDSRQYHHAGDWEFPSKHGWMISPEVESILNIVYGQTVPPARWWDVDGEGGNMSVYGQYVVNRQTYEVQRGITQLLHDLREVTRKKSLLPAASSP
jgi:hypothetical protein